MIQKARKKPVEIEVCQWTGENDKEILDFCGKENVYFARDIKGNLDGAAEWRLYIRTLEGVFLATIGDYIIKGIHGEFYPCKPDIFMETYDFCNDDMAWLPVDDAYDAYDCPNCPAMVQKPTNYCPRCGIKINYVRDFDNQLYIVESWRTLSK